MDKKNVQNRLAEITFGKKYQIIDITVKSGQRISLLFCYEIWFYNRINHTNPWFPMSINRAFYIEEMQKCMQESIVSYPVFVGTQQNGTFDQMKTIYSLQSLDS